MNPGFRGRTWQSPTIGYVDPSVESPREQQPLPTEGVKAVPTPRLFDLLVDDLKRIAVERMRTQDGEHTLQPTALVNELYLRMEGSQQVWNDRAHFLRAASQAMRHILVDHARRKSSQKRPPANRREALEHVVDELSAAYESQDVDVVALDGALRKLGEMDPRQETLVNLHFFGGRSMGECAEVLGVAERTAFRLWKSARAFLFGEMKG